MNPAIKAEWVKALRSGNYAQGKGNLRTFDDKYCCLGVLCDIGQRKAWTRRDDSYMYHYEHGGNTSYTALPGSGINTVIGISASSESALMIMNDNGDSFEEIADYIEKNL